MVYVTSAQEHVSVRIAMCIRVFGRVQTCTSVAVPHQKVIFVDEVTIPAFEGALLTDITPQTKPCAVQNTSIGPTEASGMELLPPKGALGGVVVTLRRCSTPRDMS